jgi:hypothetical protein
MKRLFKNWKVLILLIFPALITYSIWRHYQLKDFARYTIGTTTKRFITAKSGFQIEYIFYVNGKKYKGARNEYNYHIQYPGNRYFVKYSYKYPSQSEIQWNLPIPDSIKIAPPDGWQEIP